MEKIRSLFARDWNGDPSLVTRALEPGFEFVIHNDATPTRKLDGTACLIKDGRLYKRHDRKRRKKGKIDADWKPEPPGWIPCEIDERTGHWWGWALVDFTAPENWMHKEAWNTLILGEEMIDALNKVLKPGGKAYYFSQSLPDGTRELCGPNVNGNPEHLDKHVLIPHGKEILDFKFHGGDPYDEVKAWFDGKDVEGIVWWKDGKPVAKIKKRDFGLERVPSPGPVNG